MSKMIVLKTLKKLGDEIKNSELPKKTKDLAEKFKNVFKSKYDASDDVKKIRIYYGC